MCQLAADIDQNNHECSLPEGWTRSALNQNLEHLGVVLTVNGVSDIIKELLQRVRSDPRLRNVGSEKSAR